MRLEHVLIAWAVVLGVSFLLSGNAQAHRVNIFAWVEGDTVLVECKYPDGTKVHEGVIRVLDSAGKELLNGKTNTKGEFSFKVPKQDDLKIVLEAGMGHRAEWPLSKQDLAPDGLFGLLLSGKPNRRCCRDTLQGGQMNVRPLSLLCLVPALLLLTAGALAQSVQTPPAAPQPAPIPKPRRPGSISGAASPLPAGIDQAIEKALDKKLAPVMRMLAEMQEQKIRLTDVLGGIGYIIGLVGVAAYFKRKP